MRFMSRWAANSDSSPNSSHVQDHRGAAREVLSLSHSSFNLLAMKYIALLSGGKDSCYNLLHCHRNGHELVAAASLRPEPGKGACRPLIFTPLTNRLHSWNPRGAGLVPLPDCGTRRHRTRRSRFGRPSLSESNQRHGSRPRLRVRWTGREGTRRRRRRRDRGSVCFAR